MKRKSTISLKRQRAILIANSVLADRGFEVLEFRFLAPGVGGDPLLKAFKTPGNYAMWEKGGTIVPILIYMNRTRPARIPKFPHYLLQVNASAVARPGVIKLMRDQEWRQRNVRLMKTDTTNGDTKYLEVVL